MASHFLYSSEEWKRLDLEIRTDLIPTIERVRPGVEINLDREKLGGTRSKKFISMKADVRLCLDRAGLRYCESDDYFYTFFACYGDSLLKRLLKKEVKIGFFLGYPECCIESFYERCEKFLKLQGLAPRVEFGREAKLALDKGFYDEALDYILHSPCSVFCKESSKMAGKIRDVLTLNDLEAAEFLKKINRTWFFT